MTNYQHKAYDVTVILGDEGRYGPMPKVPQQVLRVVSKRRRETKRVDLD